MIDLHHGDCLEVMATLEDSSVDAIVTDPPAGISFMGKEWDADKGGRTVWVGWLSSVMAECLRVLKPGGHAFVWALPRTSHWTACAIEDAGFEIRDVVTHHFGSGFPKSHDVGKAIDKASGPRKWVKVASDPEGDRYLPAPATPEAAQWEGWGTALKPATEHWILARKPLQGTIAANVLAWSTGALNVDGGRIATNEHLGRPQTDQHFFSGLQNNGWNDNSTGKGRWPANVLLSHSAECKQVGVKRVKAHWSQPTRGTLDTSMFNVGDQQQGRAIGYADPNGLETVEAWECAEGCPVAELDRQSGECKTGVSPKQASGTNNIYAKFPARTTDERATNGGDTGGASRFFMCFEPEYDAPMFYTAKASRAERNAGCEGLPETDKTRRNLITSKWIIDPRHPEGGYPQTDSPPRQNTHPTVKPIKLMRYLCRLITPPNGTVLDPFMGSGSTGVAAIQEGFGFVGIEREAEYLAIAERRIQEAQNTARQVEFAS